MQTNEDIINLGNPEQTARFISLLGINSDDFKDSARMSRVQDILKFLSTQEDPEFFVRKAIGSKPVDRIDFVHEYISFYQHKKDAEQQKQVLDSKIDLYDRFDLTDNERLDLKEMSENRTTLDKRIGNINEQIRIYEK